MSSPAIIESEGHSSKPKALPGNARLPIEVLPFDNMGGDKENEYFSDGLGEEIINFLALIPGLKLTTRASAFAFSSCLKLIVLVLSETMQAAV